MPVGDIIVCINVTISKNTYFTLVIEAVSSYSVLFPKHATWNDNNHIQAGWGHVQLTAATSKLRVNEAYINR